MINPSKAVICPNCGKPAMVQPCYTCKVLGRNRPSISFYAKSKCRNCNDTGVVIYCESCATRQKQRAQDAARKVEQEALKRNPFLPYYDKRFRKYR